MVPGWAALTGGIFSIEVQVIFWASIAFIAAYSVLAPWWKTVMGRSLVAMDGAVATAILPSLLARYFGLHLTSAEWVAWLDVVCFFIIPVVVLSRLYLVIKVNWKKVRQHWAGIRRIAAGLVGRLPRRRV